jgi:hypothetical protein
MKVFLSYDSALACWRAARGVEEVRSDPQRVAFAPELPADGVAASDLADELACRGVDRPIHILTTRDHRKSRCSFLHLHSTTRVPPQRAFYEVGRGLYVSSPEFCFLQMAQSQSFAEQVALGYELCGSYSKEAHRDSAGLSATLYKALPLTAPKRLHGFAEANRSWHGAAQALRACQYVQGGAASPMESAIAMLLSLPNKHGGYALPCARLNALVPVTDVRTGLTVPRYCDLYWPQHNLAIEYDSDEFHASREKLNADASRRIDLALKNVEVITVTKNQLYRAEAFEDVARLAAKKMGITCRSRVFNMSEARIRLRESLLRR